MTKTPSIDDAARLDELAGKMIAEATSKSSPRILSATGFARENISILHQQRRATNLAWALSRTGRVAPGDVIGVVGGSFSGLMLAVILAMVNDAIVYVFEKEYRLLHRFRDKAHRHLSPVLNSRALGTRFDPEWSSAEFRSPIFAWEAANASEVAYAWLNEFATYDRDLPIFAFTGSEVLPQKLHPRHDGVDIDFSSGNPNYGFVSVDLLIDATGYGEEANPLGVTDYSYWDSGHQLIYDHLVPPAKVLISGCGDSGVIEGLHYAFGEFRHSYVKALWRYREGLESQIDEGLRRSRLEAIFDSGEPEARYEPEILSEIVWWLDQRYFMAYNRVSWPPGGELHLPPIYERLDALLKPHFVAGARVEPFETAEWETLEDFVLELPLADQLVIREVMRPLAEEWISRLTEELAESIPLPENIAAYTDLARPDVGIVLNGRMPTAYTRQLSPYNVWTMRLLLAFPSVQYRQGAISSVRLRPDRRFEVQFADGKTDIFDRVVTRYGPESREGKMIAQQDLRDTQRGDMLLFIPMTLVPHATDPHRGRYVDHARAAVVDGLSALEARSRSGESVSKEQIVGRILFGPDTLPKNGNLYDDPIAWLAGELRAGRYPRFDVDSDLNVAMVRG